jgi:hypothetical protein
MAISFSVCEFFSADLTMKIDSSWFDGVYLEINVGLEEEFRQWSLKFI